MKKFSFLFSFLIIYLSGLYSMGSMVSEGWPEFERGRLNRQRDAIMLKQKRESEEENERKHRKEKINNKMAWLLREHEVIRNKFKKRKNFINLNSILQYLYVLNNFNRGERENPYVFIEFLEFHINKLNFQLNTDQIKKIYPNKPILLALALKNEEAIKYFLELDIKMFKALDINNFDEMFSYYSSIIFNYLFRRYLISYERYIEYEPNYSELYKWMKFLLDNGLKIPEQIFDSSIINVLFSNFDIKHQKKIFNIVNLIYQNSYDFTLDELKIISNKSKFIAIELLIMLCGNYHY